MGSGLIWIYMIDRYGLIWIYGKIEFSYQRGDFLKIIKVCTVYTNILRGRMKIEFPYQSGLLKLKDEVKKINESNKIIVNAGKTGNRYEVSATDHGRFMHKT